MAKDVRAHLPLRVGSGVFFSYLTYSSREKTSSRSGQGLGGGVWGDVRGGVPRGVRVRTGSFKQ